MPYNIGSESSIGFEYNSKLVGIEYSNNSIGSDYNSSMGFEHRGQRTT